VPELPEVETIRLGLCTATDTHPSILGMVFRDAAILWYRSLAYPVEEKFHERIRGQSIMNIRRRGKYFIFSLSEDFLLVHLKMSGDLYLQPVNMVPSAHSRVIFNFEGDWRLVFDDPRKFGRIWLVDDPQTIIGALGPEPLDPDFNAADLYRRLHSSNRMLKPLLMDQTFLAGLGNIYTDEALHLGRLHPMKKSSSITQEETTRLWEAIRAILMEGIRRNGASIDWVYRGGNFQNFFRVYGRADQACPECGTPILRMVVSQRGTYICPFCQVL
jgi:formamidopyrimidine-DNA glycosylase